MSKNDNKMINWFALGESDSKQLVTWVFYAGLAIALYYSYIFGKAISVLLPTTITESTGFHTYSSVEAPNYALGMIGGILFFFVCMIIWKLLCELLLLVFESLRIYIDSKKMKEHSD
ncbi:hypothetical protein [Paenibacillus sp. PDC88]|uniref:hypothetical protein n=1 Tax=Paenibacillus sp. PDC88 TaxID=1884375 RepID=UPI00115FFA66|nr:hypothetical protein [Paenibacillus sp. PDC88]